MTKPDSSSRTRRVSRRALFVTQTYPRNPDDTSGPFIREIAAGLVRAGWQVGVLAPHAEGLAPRWDDAGIDVRTFRYAPQPLEVIGYSRSLERDESLRLGSALVTPAYWWAARRAVATWLQQEAFSVVHAHWIVPNGLVIPGGGRSQPTGGHQRNSANAAPPALVGYGLHGSDVFLAERPLIRQFVRGLLARGSFLTGCSPELVSRVLALAPKQRGLLSSVIPYGVDGTVFAPDPIGRMQWRRQLGLPDDACVALGVGRMATKKGFQVLLRQLDGLFAGGTSRLHLVLAGGGDREAEFRELSQQWRERVHFPGLIQRDALPSLYAAADLFVLPAVHDEKGNVDGLPNVILEAMATGLPVISTSVSGIPLAVEDEQTGLLVSEGDGRSLVEAVHRLSAHPELAHQFGAAGRRRVLADLSWDAVAGRYAGVYQSALDAAKRPGSSS